MCYGNLVVSSISTRKCFVCVFVSIFAQNSTNLFFLICNQQLANNHQKIGHQQRLFLHSIYIFCCFFLCILSYMLNMLILMEVKLCTARSLIVEVRARWVSSPFVSIVFNEYIFCKNMLLKRADRFNHIVHLSSQMPSNWKTNEIAFPLAG